jgi:hypothetical protein
MYNNIIFFTNSTYLTLVALVPTPYQLKGMLECRDSTQVGIFRQHFGRYKIFDLLLFEEKLLIS